MARSRACGGLLSLLLASQSCALLHTQLTGPQVTPDADQLQPWPREQGLVPAAPEDPLSHDSEILWPTTYHPPGHPSVWPDTPWPSNQHPVGHPGEWPANPQLAGLISEPTTPWPPTHHLAEKVWSRLTALSRSAHLPQPRLGLDHPLDPLTSSSTLKYLHEGDLLRLRLHLHNLTLHGLNSLSVQEVSFERVSGGSDATPMSNHQLHRQPETATSQVRDWHRDHDLQDEPYNDDWNEGNSQEEGEEMPQLLPARTREANSGRNGRRRGGIGKRRDRGQRPRPPATTEGIIRVAFKEVTVKAKYQVRGSAGGFLTFRESGDLTLTAPTVFLTTRLNVTIPQPLPSHRRRTQSRHGRVKVLWLKSDVSIASTSLALNPGAYPPEWVRQQVQSKLEELSSDLSHGHGAVRLLLRRWGKMLKKLIHRTARSVTK